MLSSRAKYHAKDNQHDDHQRDNQRPTVRAAHDPRAALHRATHHRACHPAAREQEIAHEKQDDERGKNDERGGQFNAKLWKCDM